MKKAVKISVLCMLLLACLLAFAACGEEEPPAPQDTTYDVVFKAGDGTVLKTETVKPGEAATAPEVPDRVGYEFIGWDIAFDKVNSDLTVTAQYERLFAVTFANYNGNTIQTVYVRAGESATAPEVPSRPKYDFLMWDKGFDNITADTVVTAVYTEKGMVTVIFRDIDGKVIGTDDVLVGTAATAPAYTAKEGYTFVSWDKSIDKVEDHMTVTAVCRENGKHLVTFLDYDGTVLSYESVANGGAAQKPADPTRACYTFSAWDGAFDNITSDTTVTAQYTENTKYTVKFVDEDGSVMKTETVHAGQAAHAPIPYEKEGYLFTGWDTAFDNVASDITVKIKYEALIHYVTFYYQYKDKTYVDEIVHGKRTSRPAKPYRTGFTFIEWQADGETFSFATAITEDINLYAVYTTNGTVPAATHKSLFMNPGYLEVWTGMTLQLDIAPSGSEIGFIQKSGATFEFVSTEPSVVTVENDGTFTAQDIGEAKVYAVVKRGGSVGSYSVKADDIISAATIRVVEAPAYYTRFLEDENQKITLGETTKSRIDKTDFLNYPTGDYGSANIALWYNDAEAALTLTVDDNNFVTDDSAQWQAWHEAYGIPVTFTVWTDRNTNYGSSATLWKQLIAQGNEIHTHGANHIKIGENTSTARIWYDMYIGQKELEKNIGTDVLTIGYANGTNYAAISSLFFIGGRGTYGTPNTVDKINYNQTNSMSTMGSSAEGLLQNLFGGSFSNGWASVHYHGIGDDAEKIETCYSQLKPYIDSGRLWAATFGSALMYAQERDTASIVMQETSANAIRFTLTDEMNDLLYNHALSVRVKVNSAWGDVRAYQGGSEIPSRIVEKDGELYVVVEAVPDAGEVALMRTDAKNVSVGADEITFAPITGANSYDGTLITYSFVVTGEAWNAATATQSGETLTTWVESVDGETRVYVKCRLNVGTVTIKSGEEQA